MAKLTMEKSIEYVAKASGALALPGLAAMIPQVGTLLAYIPMWSTALWAGITMSGLVLGAVGVGAVDMFFYSK